MRTHVLKATVALAATITLLAGCSGDTETPSDLNTASTAPNTGETPTAGEAPGAPRELSVADLNEAETALLADLAKAVEAVTATPKWAEIVEDTSGFGGGTSNLDDYGLTTEGDVSYEQNGSELRYTISVEGPEGSDLVAQYTFENGEGTYRLRREAAPEDLNPMMFEDVTALSEEMVAWYKKYDEIPSLELEGEKVKLVSGPFSEVDSTPVVSKASRMWAQTSSYFGGLSGGELTFSIGWLDSASPNRDEVVVSEQGATAYQSLPVTDYP